MAPGWLTLNLVTTVALCALVFAALASLASKSDIALGIHPALFVIGGAALSTILALTLGYGCAFIPGVLMAGLLCACKLFLR